MYVLIYLLNDEEKTDYFNTEGERTTFIGRMKNEYGKNFEVLKIEKQ